MLEFLNSVIALGPVSTSPVELIAVFFGLFSVWFMKKESILAFPFGIINVSIYVYICFSQKLYAYAGINVFYALMSIYGWINWLWKNNREETIRIARCSKTEWIVYLALIAVFFISLRIMLVKLTDSVVPTWDAITTAIYIIAMWLLARKKIENWIGWIAGDTISVFLFGYQGLWFSSLQFFVFTVIAVFGYREWRGKLPSTEA
jgi:nicotinamide mononucleotide transporter